MESHGPKQTDRWMPFFLQDGLPKFAKDGSSMKFDLPSRTDLSGVFHARTRSIDYAEQLPQLDGVDVIMEKYYNAKASLEELDETVVRIYQPKLDASYDDVVAASKGGVFIEKLPFVLLVAFILLCAFSNVPISVGSALGGIAGNIFQMLWILLIFATLIGTPVTFVLRFIKMRKQKAKFDEAVNHYNSLRNSALAELNEANANMQLVDDTTYKNLDTLYLASLDPMQREMVMMRRDQQRQHEEMVQLQERATREQREDQARLQKQQEDIRRTQQHLLDIELERERRRGY